MRHLSVITLELHPSVSLTEAQVALSADFDIYDKVVQFIDTHSSSTPLKLFSFRILSRQKYCIFVCTAYVEMKSFIYTPLKLHLKSQGWVISALEVHQVQTIYEILQNLKKERFNLLFSKSGGQYAWCFCPTLIKVITSTTGSLSLPDSKR